MKRYDVWGEYGYGTSTEEAEDGEFVKYEDAQAAIQQAVLAEREACAKLCADLTVKDEEFGVTDQWNNAVSRCCHRIVLRSTP